MFNTSPDRANGKSTRVSAHLGTPLPLSAIVSDHSGLSALAKAKPRLNLLTLDGFNTALLEGVDLGGASAFETMATLRGHQRLARAGVPAEAQPKLIAAGLDSAHAIANLAEMDFRARTAAELDAESASRIHHHARSIQSRVSHAWHSLRQHSSAFVRNNKYLAADTQVVSGLADLPSYQELFGSLDYIEVPECRSVLGAAAYFTDLMRVTYENITTKNPDILPIYALKTRRPDLYTIELTCGNTDTPLPKVDVVNAVIGAALAPTLGSDIDYAIATSVFPYQLPINLPLVELRATLNAAGAPLAQIYYLFRAQNGGAASLPNPLTTAGEALGLSCEQRAITTTAVTDTATLAQYFGQPAGSSAPSPIALAIALGNVTVAANAMTVTGTGFSTSGIAVNWLIQVGGNLRMVVAINSDTQLSVDCAWPTAASDVPATGYAPQSIVQKHVFARTTVLTIPLVDRLVWQNLDSTERAANLQANFFINSVGGNSIGGLTDTTDSNYSLSVLTNLTNANIDRINRFLRLAAAIGWRWEDLDWAIRAGGFTDITTDTIVYLAQVAALAKRLSLTIVDTTSLFAVLKTYGRGEALRPVDPFDKIYNATKLNLGEPAYRPTYSGNPLFTSTPIVWTSPVVTEADRSTQAWLKGALGLGDNDLGMLAALVGTTTNGVTTVTLDVPALSSLHAYALLAAALKWKVPALLQAMTLLGLAAIDSLSDVATVVAFKDWLDQSGLDLDGLDYVVTGGIARDVTGKLDALSIPPFIDSLHKLSKAWLLTPTSFVYDEITADEAVDLYAAFVALDLIDAQGVALTLLPQDLASFAKVAPAFPVTAADLVSDVVSPTDAENAYTLLEQHGIIANSILTGPVDDKTDLSFLFPNDPLQQTKTDSVRDVLVHATNYNWHSGRIITDALHQQDLGTYSQLGLLMQVTTELAHVLVPPQFAPANPLQKLLNDGVPIADIAKAILMADRLAYAADAFGLDALNMAPAMQAPGLLGIGSVTAPSLADIQALNVYAQAIKALKTNGVALTGFFALSAPLIDKMKALEVITGWPYQQSVDLVTALWGTTDGYNSPSGLLTMRSCFDQAGVLGLDIASALALATLSSTPMLPLPTIAGGSASGWALYRASAQAGVNAYHARYQESAWAEAYRPIHDATASQRQQALVALGILILSVDVPEIDSPTTLSEYLLIDVQTGTCNDTTPILETTQAVQMYIQRCRLALEPGVTTVDIPPIYWSWLNSFRLWQANREIYIYPESYIDPALRRGGTPLYDDFVAELSQNEITNDSVTTAYTNYINKFTALASLQMVDSVHCRVKDELSGEMIDQLIVIGRTATKPYTYYWRTLREETIWSAWMKIEASITVPMATPLYAFGRLFIFWVETETTSSTTVSANAQAYNYTTRATVNYSFQQLDGTWTAPQPVIQGDIFDFVPPNYATNTIQPSNSSSLLGIDLEMPYWYKPYTVLVPGKSGATDCIFVTFGNAYQAAGGLPAYMPATTLADLKAFDTQLYCAQSLANEAGTGGSVMFPGAAVIDADLSITKAYAFLPIKAAADPSPFGASVFEGQFALFPTTSVLIDDSLANAPDYPARVNASPQAFPLMNLADVAVITPTKNIPGWYIFNNGDEAFLSVARDTTLYEISEIVSLHMNVYYNARTPTGKPLPNVSIDCGPISDSQPIIQNLMIQYTRLTTGAGGRLSRLLFTGGVDALLSLDTQKDSGPGSLCFIRFYFDEPIIRNTCDETKAANPSYIPYNVIPPATLCGGAIDFSGSYGDYYWEIYFYIPFLIANMLRGNQRFEEAKTWFEYIFDPTAGVTGAPATTETYWQYLPFQNVRLPTLTQILTDNAAIANWNLHPYDPFAVADLRLSAYQKTIVMHYIDNLLDWGDHLFQQETRESLNQALLVYLLAGDLLGPRPKAREVAPEPPPQNFQQILDSSGGIIPPFLIDLENALPTAGPTTLDYEPAPYNAINAYFGVPENQNFLAYWTRLEDRLYKLRNCMDLSGVVRTLPFFAPPIDPGQLVAAAASGSGALNAVVYGQAVLPNYRFQTMVDRAKGLTGTLIQFGQSLLAALEKGDAEYMAMLRTQQERVIALLTTAVKQQQITEAAETRASLDVTLESATYRRDYYRALLDTGLLPAEIVSITMMTLANVSQTVAGVLRAAGGAAHLIPNVGSPFAMTYGGVQIGFAFDSLSALADTVSRNFDFASNLSSVLAGYQRRDQDWQLQEQLANYEILQLEYQIRAAQARLEAAQRDFAVSQEQSKQAEKIERVLTDKFTNEELYNWMVVRLSTIYFQTYTLAFDLAAAAQRAFQFELDSHSTFLDFGYWDSRKKGLLAGEGLMLGLSQMEQAYLAGNVRRLAIEKTISLRNINPAALVKLQTTGSCSFELSELLFDQDHPGHYRRKIERISVTIPAVVSPYQNINGMLTQTGNVVVMGPDIEAVKFLLGEEVSAPIDAALRYDWRANQQIALSRGVADTGIGPSDGPDDRYVPFEGTGAVSQWRLELPFSSNRIDYNTISDVVINLSYSAVAGGKGFTDLVRGALPTDYAGARLLNLAQEFSSAWYAFMHPGAGAPSQTLVFPISRAFFPPNLDTITMTGSFFELILEDVTYEGPLPFGLTVPGIATPFALSFPSKTPMTSVVFDIALDAGAGQSWVITVLEDDIPTELKKDGKLDPAKVVGWNMILTYTGVLPSDSPLSPIVPKTIGRG